MGILDRFKRPKEITKSTTDWGPFFPSSIWGDPGYVSSDLLSDYNKVGNPIENNATVYSAIDRIGSMISQTPFQIVEEKTNEPVSKDHPLYRIFAYPCKNWNQYMFFDAIVKNLECTGKAYIVMEQFRSSPVGVMPSVMWVSNSQYMKPIIEDGELKEYKYGEGQNTTTFDKDQIVFLRYWHPNNPYDGLAPLTAARLDVMFQWYSNQYNTRQFKDGPMISGFWKPDGPRPLTPSNEKELDDLMKQKAGKGYQNANKAPVLQGVSFQPVGISPRDLQFIEMAKMTKENILEVFRVPKALLGLTDATFNNSSEAKKSFWTSKLIPIQKMIEQFLYVGFFKKLNKPYRLEFDTTGIPELQENMLEKATVAEKLYNMGVPFALINEKLKFGFEEFVPEDRAPAIPQFSEEQIYEKIHRKKLIEKAANIPMVEAAMIYEQNKAAKTMVSYEKIMAAKLTNYWKEQYTLVINELKDNSKSTEKGLIEDAWAVLTNFVNRLTFGDGLMDAAKDVMSKAYVDGIKRVYSAVGLKPKTIIHDAEMHLANRGLKIKDIGEEIKQALLKTIADSIATTATIPETAEKVNALVKDIKGVFNSAETRAKVIARTESTAAYNGGRVRGIERLGIKRKQWIHSQDSKVRESHRTNQVVAVEDPFTLTGPNGTNKVMYPGDGPPEEACNCRCSVIPVILEDDKLGLMLPLEGEEPYKQGEPK